MKLITDSITNCYYTTAQTMAYYSLLNTHKISEHIIKIYYYYSNLRKIFAK